MVFGEMQTGTEKSGSLREVRGTARKNTSQEPSEETTSRKKEVMGHFCY